LRLKSQVDLRGQAMHVEAIPVKNWVARTTTYEHLTTSYCSNSWDKDVWEN